MDKKLIEEGFELLEIPVKKKAMLPSDPNEYAEKFRRCTAYKHVPVYYSNKTSSQSR